MSLLEEAIVDATELREAAIKNAEASILEKYSADIKEAVETMLEQPEDEAMAALGVPPAATSPEEEIPYAAAEELNLCACPDEEEVVEISFDQLEALAQAMDPGMTAEPVPEEALAMALGAEEPEEDEMMGLMEEEIEIDENILFEYEEEIIEEEVIKDLSGQKTGFKVAADSVVDHEDSLEVASRDEEPVNAKESNLPEEYEIRLSEAKKAVKAKYAEVEELKEKMQTLAESSDKLKQTFMLMKEQFEKTNLSNAKLLYTNRTLKSTSLNERQKNKIAESIQSADTIEEAKVIYETLQSTVGESRKSTPKSLNEAIKRSSINLPRQRRDNSPRESVVKNRFQALAGINKK